MEKPVHTDFCPFCTLLKFIWIKAVIQVIRQSKELWNTDDVASQTSFMLQHEVCLFIFYLGKTQHLPMYWNQWAPNLHQSPKAPNLLGAFIVYYVSRLLFSGTSPAASNQSPYVPNQHLFSIKSTSLRKEAKSFFSLWRRHCPTPLFRDYFHLQMKNERDISTLSWPTFTPPGRVLLLFHHCWNE